MKKTEPPPAPISNNQVQKAIADDSIQFDNQMMQVLDGIIAPNFDPASHKKRMEMMQERMSQATDTLL